MLRLALVLGILLPLAAAPAVGTPVYGYVLLDEYPHDPDAYTQGLVYQDGFLYEGTGRYGASSLRKVDLETGEVLLQHDLAEEYFGEGITALRDTLYQITWRENVGFTYVEADSFVRIETFDYPWQGWGLTHDGTDLIASDGSATLRFLDPRTRAVRREITVHDEGDPLTDLNELEYIRDRIYANIWYEDRIAVIEPDSGRVESYLDLAGLRELLEDPGANVLNGIAFDSTGARLLVTGKWWPKLFAIDVPPLHAAGAEEGGIDPGTAPALLSLHPNPGFSETRLRFSLPRPVRVSVAVFDVSGRAIRRFPEIRLPAGEHLVPVGLDGLVTGSYFVRWTAGDGAGSRKLSVVR
ncbi:MAG: T9SS type A sorting domain-containing protein [Candidatus Latescibacteria bacterium]|nr:T9SS type A sorting domain-containing protein [Candidatus Latescibacterota bacterium]